MIPLIVGQYQRQDKLGRVAEWCPRCWSIQTFDVARIRHAYHLYYIPLGEGSVSHHAAICQRCQLHLAIEPDRYAALADGDAPVTLDALLEQTNPDLPADIDDYLQTRRRAERRQASDDEYLSLVAEPFELFATHVAAYQQSSHRNRRPALVFLCIVACIIALIVVAAKGVVSTHAWVVLFVAVIALGVACLSFETSRDARLYLNSHYRPLFVHMLASLNPTRDQLAAARRRAARSHGFLSPHLTPKRIRAWLDEAAR